MFVICLLVFLFPFTVVLVRTHFNALKYSKSSRNKQLPAPEEFNVFEDWDAKFQLEHKDIDLKTGKKKFVPFESKKKRVEDPAADDYNEMEFEEDTGYYVMKAAKKKTSDGRPVIRTSNKSLKKA